MGTSSLPLFYQRPRPLHADSDKNLSLSSVPSFAFAAEANVIPLVATEVPAACRFYPILFAAGPLPQLVALTGLHAGENLFIEPNGDWAAGFYIPAYVRRYPFIFMENEDKSEYTLCIDEAAPSIVKGRKNPVFDKQGAPTEITNSALAFCREYQAHHALSTEFAKVLVEAELLVDHRAEVTLATGEKLNLAGFQIIDEERFNKLPDDRFLEWRRKGWLNLAICHFIATGNWQTLIERTAALPKPN
jgi:SapC